ncbi:Zinc-finger homeodomain protein 4 [Linum grandiflorum]
MAAGEEGSLAALKCAACNCHRNFHRKEGGLGAVAGDQLIPYHHPPPPPPHPPPPPPRRRGTGRSLRRSKRSR